ncbi:MAG TPA: TetR family transcriptional regulator C-terminal domain-containing protein [Steroidobacteraceae bacterium]|nr:TetR family transcriptional regulator C-terminal domain-containing protein [Steroidobacteraceae bacterium]
MSRPSAQRATVSTHPGSGGSRIRQRQRQRLIDACISALHLYGPSRTTVEKVVALAGLSPGIVRFYFDSKAAMLVASLEHLAAEFGEQLLGPVSRLRSDPVQALRLLVNLYLDADIASPRKVSVWYAFWGEASARQEYQDICGQKDEEFAALVRELMERMIAVSGASHLDADAVALGLIGVLEVLWQGIAFQSEANIDRAALVARSLRYLRSLFPGQFGEPGGELPGAPAAAAAAARGDERLPAQAYRDEALLAAEREQLLRPAWQVLGHEAELRVAGDYLSGDVLGERALVVRAERGRLYAFRNACRRRPHALVTARRGHLKSAIQCAPHSLTYSFDGRLVSGSTAGDLTPLPLHRAGGLLLIRAGADGDRAPTASDRSVWAPLAALTPLGMNEQEVAADWKLLVEQWLEAPLPQQRFIAPNQLLEVRTDGARILQVLPTVAGRSRLRRFEFARGRSGRQTRAARAGPRLQTWLAQQIALAESTQAGLQGMSGPVSEDGPVPAALARFRAQSAALLRALQRQDDTL